LLQENQFVKKLLLLCMFLCPLHALADQAPMVFGEGGQIKMLYDRRQRPQSVFLNNKVHIVFNAGAQAGSSEKEKTPSKPMAITYDPLTREFSDIVTLGPKDDDHHHTSATRRW
jgi:hypothetical protein